MDRTYVSEAFKSLQLLEEEDFSISTDGLEDAKEFINADEHDETIDIIDPEAETEEELKDEYIGKAICECNVCHSLIYKNPSEVILSEDGEIANEGEECPWCYSNSGYKVVGMVSAFVQEAEVTGVEADANGEDTEPTEGPEADEEEPIDNLEAEDGIGAGGEEKPEEPEEVEEGLTEEFHEVEVKTEEGEVEVTKDEDGKISIEIKEEKEEMIPEEPIEEPIVSEPAENEEIIAPLEPEVQAEIEQNNEEQPEEMIPEEQIEEEPEETDDLDFDVDDFDEESFDELGEGYLRKVYENVNGFKTTSVKNVDNELIVEGLIKFNSGNEKSTTFVFEAAEATKDGNVKFLGENKHFSRGKKSFTLLGNVNENKFIAESFNYNYHAKDVDGKAVRLYGTVKRAK